MNCDRVFDVLTRGPFPTGAESDDAVEHHLAVCPQCRRLAAALRPAIELFEEAVAPEESRGLPSYWGEVCTAPSDYAPNDYAPSDYAPSDYQTATDTDELPDLPRPVGRTPHTRSADRRTSAHGLLFTGAAILGVVLAAAIHFALPRDQAVRAGGLETLRSLGLGDNCLISATSAGVATTHSSSFVRTPPDEPSLATLQCCLECHASDGSLTVGQEAILRIGRSCQVCHL